MHPFRLKVDVNIHSKSLFRLILQISCSFVVVHSLVLKKWYNNVKRKVELALLRM